MNFFTSFPSVNFTTCSGFHDGTEDSKGMSEKIVFDQQLLDVRPLY